MVLPASEIEAAMERWVEDLGKFYEPNSELRNETLQRLTMKYWFNKITSHFHDDNHNDNDHDSDATGH